MQQGEEDLTDLGVGMLRNHAHESPQGRERNKSAKLESSFTLVHASTCSSHDLPRQHGTGCWITLLKTELLKIGNGTMKLCRLFFTTHVQRNFVVC
ncbi:hypothetical protein WN943_016003 [Citrus x changshan-huyou]